MEGKKKYVKVIVPLRLREAVTYSVPEEWEEKIRIGSRVDILLANKPYKAIVQDVTEEPGFDPNRIKDIVGVDDILNVSQSEISFWKTLADYYMCSVGEVLKAATPILMDEPKTKRVKKVVSKKKETSISKESQVSEESLPFLNMKILTPCQQEAFEKIKAIHKKGLPALLDGATSSGKTEIYLHAVKECLEEGKNALVLIPDIASGKELIDRFMAAFSTKAIIYHNQLTLPKKKLAVATLRESFSQNFLQKESSTSCKCPVVVISTRSGILLPLGDLGLVIVDDEHDSAYKHQDPAPRYNGRDTALILAKAKAASVILGSATPSFESLFNAACGKYAEVTLPQMHQSCHEAVITVIDTVKEKKKRAITGSYTTVAAKAIAEAAEKGEEIAIFKPRRAFAQDDALAAEIITLFKSSGICLFSDIKEIEDKEKKPDLIVVLQGEALLNQQDFRGDEKCVQLLTKLKGILEKSGKNGHLIIQTSQPNHNVFKALSNPFFINALIKERENFGFPPYKRMIQISIKDTYEGRLQKRASKLMEIISDVGINDFSAPTPPPYEKIPNEHTLIIRIRLKRDRNCEPLKRLLLSKLETAKEVSPSIDVDPL